MQHVADNRDRQVVERFLVVANGVHVQQALRWMRVSAIAGVDHCHTGLDVLCNQVRRARLCVAHHKHVGIHRSKVIDGIEQRFALGGGGGVDIKIDHIR